METIKRLLMYVFLFAGAMFFNAGMCANDPDDEDVETPTSGPLEDTKWRIVDANGGYVTLTFTDSKHVDYKAVYSGNIDEYTFTYTYSKSKGEFTAKADNGNTAITGTIDGNKMIATFGQGSSATTATLVRVSLNDPDPATPGGADNPDDPTTPDDPVIPNKPDDPTPGTFTDASWEQWEKTYPLLTKFIKPVDTKNIQYDASSSGETGYEQFNQKVTIMTYNFNIQALSTSQIDELKRRLTADGYKLNGNLYGVKNILKDGKLSEMLEIDFENGQNGLKPHISFIYTLVTYI